MRHNLAAVRGRVGHSRIWAVAKANAYGQGIAQAVLGFAEADGLAVLDLAEAKAARDGGWTRPILMIEGAFSQTDLAEMASLNLETVVSTPEQAEMFASAPVVPKSVWVKLNTGMNRLGFSNDIQQEKLITMLRAIRSRIDQPLCWMTHFANADTEQGWQGPLAKFMDWQRQLAGGLRDAGVEASGSTRGHLSLANSAASLMWPATHADWVRPGIALYGASPYATGDASHSAAAFGLRPVQILESQLIAVQTVAAGESVGYGSRFTATRNMRVGVVAAGYADGYPRSAPDGTPISVDGRIVPLAGRVSMDMITVDITGLPSAGVGSRVELWGSQVDVDDVAYRSGTIGYELLTKVTPRVPRKVVDGQG